MMAVSISSLTYMQSVLWLLILGILDFSRLLSTLGAIGIPYLCCKMQVMFLYYTMHISQFVNGFCRFLGNLPLSFEICAIEN